MTMARILTPGRTAGLGETFADRCVARHVSVANMVAHDEGSAR